MPDTGYPIPDTRYPIPDTRYPTTTEVTSMSETRELCGAPPTEEMLVGYYNQMVEPKPFIVRTGAAFRRHQRQLRRRILRSIGLSPLPERVPLDVREHEALQHPWCTIQAVTYQLWPGVRARAFFYLPLEMPEQPAPAMLSVVGHWQDGSAHPCVQTRCANLARLGYVVLCTTQHHFEDLAIGISHQTLMVWNNMRALDLLQSLPEVDGERIGCAGCSGGALQTQMLVALDERVKAATVAGITCDYREILFPYRAHCTCNHWPGAMQLTDQPEIAALALPRPIQFLTMNDWTRNFGRDNLPAIRALYEANGAGDRVDHKYWPTPHEYDRPKRERTYQWMERWLRGKRSRKPPIEPEMHTFPPAELLNLFQAGESAPCDRDSGFERLGVLYRERYGRFSKPRGKRLSREEVASERRALRTLLGLKARPTPCGKRRYGKSGRHEGLALERVAFPSEGPVLVPTLLLRNERKPVREIRILCDDRPKEERLGSEGVVGLAKSGALVVLPDVRFVGALGLDKLKGRSKALVAFAIAEPYDEPAEGDYAQSWTRNGILWGRPLPGMTATDICAVLSGVLRGKRGAKPRVHLVARGQVAAGALFAACLDDRIDRFNLDFDGRSFAAGDLPLVPNILLHGDVAHWLKVAQSARKGR
jgi:hypothetical protein